MNKDEQLKQLEQDMGELVQPKTPVLVSGRRAKTTPEKALMRRFEAMYSVYGPAGSIKPSRHTRRALVAMQQKALRLGLLEAK